MVAALAGVAIRRRSLRTAKQSGSHVPAATAHSQEYGYGGADAVGAADDDVLHKNPGIDTVEDPVNAL